MTRWLAPAVSVFVVMGCSSTPPVSGCPAGQNACGQTCATLLTDDSNCGSCGHACSAGEGCGDGTCLPTTCDGGACEPGSVCFRGACASKACAGVICSVGQACSQGRCVCGPAHTECDGRCADLKHDDASCGACGKTCAANEGCAGGACLPRDCPTFTCDPLSVCYSGTCADRLCVGVICPQGLTCRSGVCTCPEGSSSATARAPTSLPMR